MKKSIIPSILTGGAVISLVAILAVAMVFICIGDDIDTPAQRPSQGMPQLIGTGEGEEAPQAPSFDFNDTKGHLEISFDGSTLFRTENSVHVRSKLRIKELFGHTVTVKNIRYSVYNGSECVYTGYIEPSELLKSTVISGGGLGEFSHTVELFDSHVVGEVSLVYVITWQDSEGNEGVGSCRRDYTE